MRRLLCPLVITVIFHVGSACAAPVSPGASTLTVYRVKPTDANPALRRFNASHVVMFKAISKAQDLFLFLPGTSNKPEQTRQFLEMAADAGYRVIGLSYNNEPSVAEACKDDGNSDCAGLVRSKRTFGDGVTNHVDDIRNESIVSRLTDLLVFLDHAHPSERWRAYLSGSEPKWSRIVLAGFSQGGGMAAFIAKHRLVSRLIMLSGGWDFVETGADRGSIARWYYDSSATPHSRWYACYHNRELQANRIARAYGALQIPPDHIKILTGKVPPAVSFHASVVLDAANEETWRFLIGRSR